MFTYIWNNIVRVQQYMQHDMLSAIYISADIHLTVVNISTD